MADNDRNSVLRWDTEHGRWVFMPLNSLARELVKKLDPDDWVCEQVGSERSAENTGERYRHLKQIDHHGVLAKLYAVGIVDVIVQIPYETR